MLCALLVACALLWVGLPLSASVHIPDDVGLKALRYVSPATASARLPVRSKTVTKTKWGRAFTFSGPAKSRDLKPIAEDIWDSDEYGLALHNIPPQATILEFGGNVGVAAVALGAHYPDATILTFEPMPVNFQFLLHNLRTNNITNVRPHNVGLSADGKPADFTFFLPFGGSSSTHTSLHASYLRRHPQDFSKVRVHTVMLSQIRRLYGIQSVDLMKIDCEGCEYSVIPQLQDMRVARFVGELHPDMPGVSHSMFEITIRTLCNQEGQAWGKYVTRCCNSDAPTHKSHTALMAKLRSDHCKGFQAQVT
mmetsp:Transcript_40638/g.72735  ORF Transcript_40638/g.72735 Transcript_40638/m.72735 type:complete len:308 (-) Transcript_40638:1434-2357(-)